MDNTDAQNDDSNASQAQELAGEIYVHCPPVSRIPVETLCEVFLLVTESSIPLTFEGPRKDHPFDWPRQWLRLTHVCRFWRTAAIDLPRLWRCLALHASPAMHFLFLQRSGTQPIILTNIGRLYTSSSQQTEYASDLIATLANRITALDRIVLSSELMKGIKAKLGGGRWLPVLEHLRFILPSDVELSPELFTPEALPRLRSLSAAPRYCPRSATLLQGFRGHNLTSLRFAFPANVDYRQTNAKWLEILAGFSALEHVVLRNVLRDTDEPLDRPSSGPSISLPHLKTLKLIDDHIWRPYVKLVYDIYCVMTTTLDLVIDGDSDYYGELFSALHTLAYRDNNSQGTPFLAASIRQDYEHWILKLWTKEYDGPHWRIKLFEDYDGGGSMAYDLLSDFRLPFLNSLTLTDVDLILDDPDMGYEDWWRNIATARTLTIRSRATLVDFLKLAREAHRDQKYVVLPYLELLVLDRVTWRKDDDEGDEGRDGTGESNSAKKPLTSQLEYFLHLRRLRKAPLPHLKVLRAFQRGDYNPERLRRDVDIMEWEDTSESEIESSREMHDMADREGDVDWNGRDCDDDIDDDEEDDDDEEEDIDDEEEDNDDDDDDEDWDDDEF